MIFLKLGISFPRLFVCLKQNGLVYFTGHLDVEVVLVAVAPAVDELLALVRRRVVVVPGPRSSARTLLRKKITKFWKRGKTKSLLDRFYDNSI